MVWPSRPAAQLARRERVGEAERGDQADTNTNCDGGGQRPGQPGDLDGNEPGGRQGKPDGHTGWDGADGRHRRRGRPEAG